MWDIFTVSWTNNLGSQESYAGAVDNEPCYMTVFQALTGARFKRDSGAFAYKRNYVGEPVTYAKYSPMKSFVERTPQYSFDPYAINSTLF